jgi:small conductance mechanosensitive channel
MFFSEIEWGVVLHHAAYLLALWAGLWLLRRLIVKRLPRLLTRLVGIELEERDRDILTLVVDITVLVLGVAGTLVILDLAPVLIIGAVGSRVLALIVVWALVWLLVRYLNIWIQALNERFLGIDLEERELVTLDRVLDAAIILIGIIITLAILKLTPLLYSALTAAGLFGVMVGLAVKDIAANFLAGLFIVFDRPFVIGDTIKVKDFVGAVSKISLRSTELITLEGLLVTFPNSMVTTEPTTNYTVSRFRRILFVVSVLGSVDLNRAVQVIRETLDADRRLLADRPPTIYVDRIRDYAVDLQITAFTSPADVFDTQSDLKQAVTAAFASHGIELAVPVQVSYVAEASPGAPFTGLSPRPPTADHERPSRHD